MTDSKQKPTAHKFDEKLLLRYSIQVCNPGEPDYDGTTMSEIEMIAVSDHLAICPLCKEKVDQFTNEFKDIEHYLEEAGFVDTLIGAGIASGFSRRVKKIIRVSLDKLKGPLPVNVRRRVPLIAGGFAFVLAAVFAGQFFLRADEPYVRLAFIDATEITNVTRSGSLSGLSELMATPDLNNRIVQLERYKAETDLQSDKQYALYLLGVSYLIKARVDFLGQFRYFDTESVEKAILNLQAASHSLNNEGLHESCNWYLAKAHIMKKDWSKAKIVLERIIEFQGRRFSQAQSLLAEVEESSP